MDHGAYITTIQSNFHNIISQITVLIERNNQHLLICGADSKIISTVVELIDAYAISVGRDTIHVHSASHKDQNPQGKVFFIRIAQCITTSIQSLIYYYLSKSRTSECCLILISNSCTSLDAFEKRVKSRFNHKIFFIGFISLESYAYLYFNAIGKHISSTKDLTDHEKALVNRLYSIDPGITTLEKNIITHKYNIPEYSIETLYSLFDSVHIALITIATKKRIKYINCVSEFKAFTSGIKELKKIDPMEVICSFLDLINSGIIGIEGDLLIDVNCFKRYVINNRQVHLKTLLHKNIP
ncbi:hypothetical protein CWI42_030950 [Ordospora colligata]|uniref:Uncharacterized protein n=1 Tax=Ordospora colligata OC4 TaxID=1354746 RepID=A0A0B2UL99_9MICR|nr:uncharacterized protein M896_030660 [Ordospora colligata OC4]KHN70079.1 hypothetical protein M896_030660 [Ordospora colligata OC4]TBU16461.1 hypothetical protein CWI41_030620 [Ordospora colligata]TBU16646.1 hypothetical protein CWI40_031020 [Ordospora colligata]TBU19219.1 hypothetical protein CWI42_030950 [Ordospora colligata]